MISSISVEDFLKLPDNISIIDIRNSQSFNNNHIPGAINIPYEKLLSNHREYLEHTKRYYLYCQKGVTSRKVSSILNQLGYLTTSLSGGYEEWVMKKG